MRQPTSFVPRKWREAEGKGSSCLKNAPDRFLHRFEAGDDPVEREFSSLPRLGVGSLFLPQEFDILFEFVQSPAQRNAGSVRASVRKGKRKGKMLGRTLCPFGGPVTARWSLRWRRTRSGARVPAARPRAVSASRPTFAASLRSFVLCDRADGRVAHSCQFSS